MDSKIEVTETKSETKKKRPFLTAKRTEILWGYVFCLPNLIGFVVFTFFGIIFSLTMSFTDWSLLRDLDMAKFVGLDNFKAMFSDIYLGASLRNNAWLLLVVPVGLFIARILASIINQSVYGKAVARAMFFLPYVTNMVAISTVWQALYHPTKGPINMFLMSLGVAPENLPQWLSHSKWALFAVMIILLWQTLGYYILMYSAALQNIPTTYYEAARIDGAGAFRCFRHITVPLIRPTTFLLTILGLISSMQMWTFVQIITNGGPGTATYTLGLHIYRTSFESYRTGYASALSWLLCLIVMLFTVIRWQGEKRITIE